MGVSNYTFLENATSSWGRALITAMDLTLTMMVGARNTKVNMEVFLECALFTHTAGEIGAKTIY